MGKSYFSDLDGRVYNAGSYFFLHEDCMRYYLLLKPKKENLFLKSYFRFKDKKAFKEALSSFYKRFPVTKFDYVYGVSLLTAVKKRRRVFQ
jgi:hypothetical protein